MTNASHAPGPAVAIALAQAGARILLHHYCAPARVETIAEEIRSAGGTAKAIGVDLLAAAGPAELAQTARTIVGDRLDILVLDAGDSRAVTIEGTTAEDFDTQFTANVRAPFCVVRQLLPILGDGSSIIFTARTAPDAGQAHAYTQLAIASLVSHLAPLLGPRGIRVNAVMPAPRPARTKAASECAPGADAVRRLGRPDDIGGAVAFLASNEARWITGDITHSDEPKRRNRRKATKMRALFKVSLLALAGSVIALALTDTGLATSQLAPRGPPDPIAAGVERSIATVNTRNHQ